MADTHVILQDNDNWAPLIGVTIKAIDAIEGTQLDSQVTDLAGHAVFDVSEFPETWYFFRAEVTRNRPHMLVIPAMGRELYGIDNNSDYVDGRDNWDVAEAGAVGAPRSLKTSPDGLTMYHIDVPNLGSYGSLYRSTDDGDTWQVVAPPNVAYTCAAIDIAPDGKLWSVWFEETGTDDQCFIYSSEDLGETWTKEGEIEEDGLGFQFPLWIAVNPDNPSQVGLVRADTLGTGTRYFDGPPFPSLNSDGTVVEGTFQNQAQNSGQLVMSGSSVIVGVRNGTGGNNIISLYKGASNGSGSFTEVYTRNAGAATAQWSQMVRTRDSSALFAGYSLTGSTTEGLLRSLDGGATWQEMEVPTGFGVTTVVYDPMIDVLYIFRVGFQSNAYYALDHPGEAVIGEEEWEGLDGPVAGFRVGSIQQVTWVPKRSASA